MLVFTLIVKHEESCVKHASIAFAVPVYCSTFSSFRFHGLSSLSGEKILLTSYPVTLTALKVDAM